MFDGQKKVLLDFIDLNFLQFSDNQRQAQSCNGTAASVVLASEAVVAILRDMAAASRDAAQFDFISNIFHAAAARVSLTDSDGFTHQGDAAVTPTAAKSKDVAIPTKTPVLYLDGQLETTRTTEFEPMEFEANMTPCTATLTLTSLCLQVSDVVSSVLYPFLTLADHFRAAQSCKSMLSLSGRKQMGNEMGAEGRA